MIEFLLGIAIGLLVGWHVPQPKWAKLPWGISKKVD